MKKLLENLVFKPKIKQKFQKLLVQFWVNFKGPKPLPQFYWTSINNLAAYHRPLMIKEGWNFDNN